MNDTSGVKISGPVFNYGFGDLVVCSVSGRPIECVVTYLFTTGENKAAYHCRDEFGQYWHRTEKEMRGLFEPPELSRKAS